MSKIPKYKKRCKDCVALIEHEDYVGKWFCDEDSKLCKYVKVCPEGLDSIKEGEQTND